MKLSIITVNLNNRDGLQRTIDSVISQTFRDFEWIVIDGGSTDGSRELIEQYSDHFAYWVSEPDKGIYNAMNKGIKVAKGEYLQFLNSGDWLDNNEVICDFAHSEPVCDIVYGDTNFYKDGVLIESRKYPNQLSFFYLFHLSIGHCSTYIHNSLFESVRYDENLRISSDWKFFIQMALEGRSFSHFPYVVSCFDLSGVSSNNPKLSKDEKKEITKEIIPHCIYLDMEKLSYFEHLEIDNFDILSHQLRRRNRVYRNMATLLLKIME